MNNKCKHISSSPQLTALEFVASVRFLTMTFRVLFVLGIALASFGAAACSCVRLTGDIEADVQSSWGRSMAVMTAFAYSVESYYPDGSYQREFQRVLWRVTHSWKGPYSVGSTFVTETEITFGVCGAEVSLGREWLLYLHQYQPYQLSSCSIGRELSKSTRQIPVLNRLSSEASRDGT